MPLSFHHHAGSPPANWDRIVSDLGGTIFHSTAWATYQKEARGVRPLFLLGRDEGGEVVAAALAFLEQSSRPLLALIFRDLTLSSHPVGPGAGPAFMLECERLARAMGCRQISVESFMSGQSSFLPAEGGYAEVQRVEFCLDLTRERDVLWKGIRKDQRERINRLPREGVEIDVGSSLDDLAALGAARESTRDKRASRGQGYDLDADPAFYERLHRHLVSQGAARLFVARQSGEVIAAILYSTFNRRAYSVFSGSTQGGYRLGAQSGLFWAAVESFRSDGHELLNRGGVPASAREESDALHGIYQFKLRLGTTPEVCRSGRKILSGTRARLAQVRDGLRRRLAAARSETRRSGDGRP
jgi:hypothetical protein